jgi:hypothetical protein
MFRKIVISLLLFSFLFNSLLVKTAYAQDVNPWYRQTFHEWYTKVYDHNMSPPNEIFGERYTAAQVSWIIYGVIAFILNADGNTQRNACLLVSGDVQQCLDANPLFGGSAFVPEPSEDGVFATIFSPQRDLSLVTYTRTKIANFSPAPEAYAQGFGFGALNPLQTAWKTFRNISYAFFVIIILVMAFLIMFRYRISPQAIITVQTAIPRIIIALLLVTFSYAIAGLLVDLTYVVIGVLALVMTQSGIFQATWSQMFLLLTEGPVVFGMSLGALGWVVGIIEALFFATMGAVYSITGFGSVTQNVAFGILTFVGFLLVFIVSFWILIVGIKVMILVVKTYISILLLVIFAPIQITIGAISPSSGFSSWVRNLVGNLAVYPIIGVIFLLVLIFLGGAYPLGADSGFRISGTSFLQGVGVSSPLFTPEGSEVWYPPLSFGVQTAEWDPLPLLWIFAAVGILATATSAGNLAKSLIAGKGMAGVEPEKMSAIFAGPGAIPRPVLRTEMGQKYMDWKSSRAASRLQEEEALWKSAGAPTSGDPYINYMKAAQKQRNLEAERRRKKV